MGYALQVTAKPANCYFLCACIHAYTHSHPLRQAFAFTTPDLRTGARKSQRTWAGLCDTQQVVTSSNRGRTSRSEMFHLPPSQPGGEERVTQNWCCHSAPNSVLGGSVLKREITRWPRGNLWDSHSPTQRPTTNHVTTCL